MKNEKKKKAPVIICSIVVVLLIIIAVSCSMMPEPGVYVNTTTATRGEVQESISTSGTISSEEQKVIFAEINGKLAQVNVAAGDAVKAGDVLVSYDMNDAENSFKQASLQQDKSTAGYQAAMADNSENQAKLNEANTNLAVLDKQLTGWKAYLKELQDKLNDHLREEGNSLAEESLELSNRSADLQNRLEMLDKAAPDYTTQLTALQDELQSVSEAISHNQYEQQTVGTSDYVAGLEKEIAKIQDEIAGFEEYKAEMESQKMSSEGGVLDSYDKKQYAADKDLAGMSYETAEEAYNAAKQGVVAEFDGIVMECSAIEGSTVSEGMQLLTIADSQNLKITFDATKYDIQRLKVGQSADITIFDKTYEGTVSKINRMATLNEYGSTTPMVGVEVHITNPDENIILGLDAKLEVYVGKAENALLIPVEAINADQEGDFLYVVENGIVVRKPIVCGISSDTYTEVLEGITEEDQIIVSSMSGVEEGMAVTVMPAQ